mgnify:CR=1 FL=1
MWEYTDKVKEHFLNPRNVGEVENLPAQFADAIAVVDVLVLDGVEFLIETADCVDHLTRRHHAGADEALNEAARTETRIVARLAAPDEIDAPGRRDLAARD